MTRTLSSADVVVCGPGLAAAAVALELARRDLDVVLLAPGRAGRPSSPGAPVAAQAFVEEAAPEARGRLALFARDLFPDWLSGLEEETGVSGELDERGALTVAFDEPEEVLLDRALDALQQLDPQQSQIVELRFFGGLSIEEAAEVLKISPATVKRDWVMAKAWLRRHTAPNAPAEPAP